MSGPGFTRPDLCSIRAADGQAEHAEAARQRAHRRRPPTGRR